MLDDGSQAEIKISGRNINNLRYADDFTLMAESKEELKKVRQGCILSPCLFNLYAENIMRNIGLDEAQAGIKIARRTISNLRYADILLTESEEELR